MAIWFKYSIKSKFNLKFDIKRMAWKVVSPQNLGDNILWTQPKVKCLRVTLDIILSNVTSPNNLLLNSYFENQQLNYMFYIFFTCMLIFTPIEYNLSFNP